MKIKEKKIEKKNFNLTTTTTTTATKKYANISRIFSGAVAVRVVSVQF